MEFADSDSSVQSYGLWRSGEPIESVFRQPSPPAYPFRNNGKLCWLEARPQENGRIVLMQEKPGHHPECITPEPFNIRSAVHEYGGRCFCVIENFIIFNNFKDGNLYCQSITPESEPQLLIPGSESECGPGFADLVAVNKSNIVIGIAENSETDGENSNCIVAISLVIDSRLDRITATGPVTLEQGADFYANPVVSGDAGKIAWFEWSHPNMPWDQSRLLSAELKVHEGEISLYGKQVIVDEKNRSVCQLGFLSDSGLVFASDSDVCDYWNLFEYRDGNFAQLTHGCVEFGEAHWVFGQRRWVGTDNETIIAVTTGSDGDALVRLDRNSGDCRKLHQGFSACSHLQLDESDEILLVTHYSDRSPEISSLSARTGSIQSHSINNRDNAGRAEGQGCSEPTSISFPTGDGDIAYGYFYPPYNPLYTPPENELPPLMIVIHGGPTSRATSEYSGVKQHFCALGFALLDINHRGSTGYGRKFRQSLLGNWGEFDADDIASAIQYVVSRKWVDKALVFIRGSSAGGYAVLRALTRFPALFAAGACYYGIGNLITLSNLTHKFESKYTDRLVGECFSPETSDQPQRRFVTRSPVFQIDDLSSQLILFQGEDDKVVPPGLSREVVKLLDKKDIKHSYTEYPGEGHGFRKIETRVDSLEKETAFFAEIIREKKSVKSSKNCDENNCTT